MKRSAIFSLVTITLLICNAHAATQHADTNEIARVVTLLQSPADTDISLAKDILTKDPRRFVDSNGVLDQGLIDALISCYERLPPFASSFEVTKENSVAVTRSPKVLFFMLLSECGGEKVEGIIQSAAQGDDPVLRKMAETQLDILKQKKSKSLASQQRYSTAASEQEPIIAVADLSNYVARVLVTGGIDEKQDAIRKVLAERRQLREAGSRDMRTGIVGVLKGRFSTESNLAVREDILTAIANLDDTASADAFLQSVINDSNVPSFLRNQAKYIREALAAGVFR